MRAIPETPTKIHWQFEKDSTVEGVAIGSENSRKEEKKEEKKNWIWRWSNQMNGTRSKIKENKKNSYC